MIIRCFALLLIIYSCSFAEWNVADWRISFKSVVDKFAKSQTVAQKLETAPIAYYGKLIQREYLNRDYFEMRSSEFEKNYPELYQTFMGWSEYKQNQQKERLMQAPATFQQMFEERYSSMAVRGFFLVHDEIRVDKVYDKETKTWVTPKSGEEKKELFSFAYVGPDISKDSSWKFSQRMMSLLPETEDLVKPTKRIFFLDGFSEECYSLMDAPLLEQLQYYPHRMKYDIDPNAVNFQKSEPVVATMPRPDHAPVARSVGSFGFNAYADFGRPFLVGDFPDFDPLFYLGFGFNIYFGDWFGGIGLSIRNLDAKCDSCGTGDFGAHVEFGYRWLKKDYIESGVWGNLGFSAIEVPPQKGIEDSEYQHERYFRYGFGVYAEALFPKLVVKPVESLERREIKNRFGARLKLGLQNMNVSEIGHAKGFSPFVSLGFTWHLISLGK